MLNCNLKQIKQDSRFLSYQMTSCSTVADYTTERPKFFVDLTPTTAYSNVSRPIDSLAVGPGSNTITIEYGGTSS
jgi:hypothetical protein